MVAKLAWWHTTRLGERALAARRAKGWARTGRLCMLQDGDIAPDFELATDSGEPFRLSKLRGKPVVVYFYPKDDTSGCTIEAKDFSRLAPEFRQAGIEVIGVSPDSVESHQTFRSKHELAIRLAKSWRKVKVPNHAQEVLTAARSLGR